MVFVLFQLVTFISFIAFWYKSTGPFPFVLLNMMTCQISVTNKFRSIQFFLFQEPPEIQNGPSDQIFSTMYQASDRVYPSQDGSSTAQFQVQNTCYAISGSLKHGPYPRIITNDSRMVRLGPGGSVLALTAPDYALTWNDAAVGGRQCANNGAFQLITDDTIPTNISAYLSAMIVIHPSFCSNL